MNKIVIKKYLPYWREYRKAEKEFFNKVSLIEEKMRNDLKNPNLEFAYAKYGEGISLYFGIGFNYLKETNKPMIYGDKLDNEVIKDE